MSSEAGPNFYILNRSPGQSVLSLYHLPSPFLSSVSSVFPTSVLQDGGLSQSAELSIIRKKKKKRRGKHIAVLITHAIEKCCVHDSGEVESITSPPTSGYLNGQVG